MEIKLGDFFKVRGAVFNYHLYEKDDKIFFEELRPYWIKGCSIFNSLEDFIEAIKDKPISKITDKKEIAKCKKSLEYCRKRIYPAFPHLK